MILHFTGPAGESGTGIYQEKIGPARSAQTGALLYQGLFPYPYYSNPAIHNDLLFSSKILRRIIRTAKRKPIIYNPRKH
jgi:hypothetical protein